MRPILNKNDVLLFDKSQNLTKKIEHYCGCNVQILFCKCIRDFLAVDFKTISTVYFNIESINHCRYIFKILKEVDSIYLITDLDVEEKFKNYNNVFFIDNKSNTNDIIYEIYQKTIELNNI